MIRKYIREILPNLEWRWFGVGALQAYLSEGGRTEQRVHIWHPLLVRAGIQGAGDSHNHRFSFRSEVLCGEIFDTPIDVIPGNTWGLWRVENARSAKARLGTHDGSIEKRADCGVWFWPPRRVEAGQCYDMPRGDFHRSQARGVTVTLLTKYDQDDNQRAEILCPNSAQLVHAFGGPQPVPTECVLRDALEALS